MKKVWLRRALVLASMFIFVSVASLESYLPQYLQFKTDVYSVDENLGDENADIQVVRFAEDENYARSASVNFRIVGGTAVEGVDFDLVNDYDFDCDSFIVDFGNDTLESFIEITIYDNEVHEGDKTIKLELMDNDDDGFCGPAGHQSELGDILTATVTIIDDEVEDEEDVYDESVADKVKDFFIGGGCSLRVRK